MTVPLKIKGEEENKFSFRRFRADDYEMVSRWWQAHEWPVIPFASLPSIGVVVFFDNQPACAGFLYSTDSDLRILEWVVTNPDVEFLQRSHALDILLAKLCEEAKNTGARLVFTMLKHEKLMNRFQSHGFMKTDEGMTHFIKEI